ncbi:hypothetical protein D778_00447 [Xanthomarina gelatinilytica]|uniref:Uncharacterized protein n=1 Tax=Xanthomarina gelatinilytica TaxID=1137281 RepID=M7MF27_9FLAO|nr:hypothetical protein D778_00447 [Xanthomarina gelatinilytica]
MGNQKITNTHKKTTNSLLPVNLWFYFFKNEFKETNVWNKSAFFF